MLLSRRCKVSEQHVVSPSSPTSEPQGVQTLVLAPLCNGDLLQLVEESGAMSEVRP